MKRILTIQSHVVYGHAGNSAAVFPMRRLGADVWPLNTVQFSNHTQYPQYFGSVLPAEQIGEIVKGLDAIGQLKRCDAVLSGYLGAPTQGQAILDALSVIKTANPQALYFCDPVMGHPEKGCIVAPGVAEFLIERALPVADIVAPNILELASLAGRGLGNPLRNLDEALAAARALLDRGPGTVLVKHLAQAGRDPNAFEMLLVDRHEAWHVSRPLFDFAKQPVGVGDLTSGLLLVNLLHGKSLKEALEHTTAAVYEALRITYEHGEYELQLVAAQDLIAQPKAHFAAQRLTF
ncbi:MAG: pyridoxal kinase PdxY [Burkholderiales bacterium]|jgi:pyridoxine kinase|nr:pyridoxal kinase PdxY [Burkholderiales bacterium]